MFKYAINIWEKRKVFLEKQKKLKAPGINQIYGKKFYVKHMLCVLSNI